ncbi:polyprenyl synthetase family protein [Streptomyces sp. CA-181903]|uniref:polyprenyl synthetase family protein n=1 Tax=Streptomyces sp. CA-181903 TaxID=3240055 RepID=UPI003D949342
MARHSGPRPPAVGAGAGEDGAVEREGLAALRLLLREALADRWDTQQKSVGAVCRYALASSGKLLRPLLLLEAAQAVGGDPHSVLPAAVGTECGHVASLIHDDIIDGDAMRRGRPSVPHRFGAGEALLAGDCLIFDAFAALAECRHRGVPHDRIVMALEVVAGAGRDLCRGQSLEAELTAASCFDIGAYLEVARLKTAAFFRGAGESGAVLGGGTTAQVGAIRDFGRHLGIAFQIHDDLLPYISTSAVTGKPDTSDVRNRRLTLPLLLAHEAASGPQREALRRALRDTHDAEHALRTLARLTAATGAVAAAAAQAENHVRTALQALQTLPTTAGRARLGRLAQALLISYR